MHEMVQMNGCFLRKTGGSSPYWNLLATRKIKATSYKKSKPESKSSGNKKGNKENKPS
jgi:hypothetical protein